MPLTLEQFNKLKVDFPIYCNHNIWIKDAGGRLIKLRFNKLQKRLWQLFQEDWNRGGGQIRWYVTKMRKGGASTFFVALFYWLSSLSSNKNSLIVAHDEDAAKAMINTIQTFHLRSDKQLRPKTRTMNRKEIYFANSLDDAEKTGDIGLDSHIDSATVDTRTLGRSYTYQYALLTEFAQYPELGIDIDERMVALFNAVPDEEDIKSFIVLESTARGENAAKEFWDDNDNGFRKIFIGFVASEKYRNEISIDDYFELSELPDSKYGNELAERDKIINEIRFWYPDLTTNAEIEHEAMCRLSWRRHKINTSCRGSKTVFKQEFPTTSEDAFSTSSNSIFSVERILEIEEVLNNLKLRPKKYRYQHADEVKDETRKFYEATYGHLHIYKPPQPGIHYVIGADGAQGVPGGDDSTAYVIQLPSLEEVAMFSYIIRPDEFAGVLNYLGLLYNKALLGVELNDKGGYAAVEKLYNFYHYPNLYYQVNPFKSKVSSTVQYGWNTGPDSRQVMLRDFCDLIENNNIYIKSKKLLTQMKSFVILPNGKAAALPGKHDDVVISAMIAVQMSKQIHISRPIIPSVAPRGSPDWWMRQMGRQANQRQQFRRK